MRKIIIDTNLLCLLIVGLADKSKIGQHKRLRAFTVLDFDHLTILLSNFSTIVTTPQIITETSNLLRHSPEPLRASLSNALAQFVRHAEELSYASIEIINHPQYAALGVTDCTVMIASGNDAVILSDDLGLFLAASRSGAKIINYNYFRDGAMSSKDLNAIF